MSHREAEAETMAADAMFEVVGSMIARADNETADADADAKNLLIITPQ